MPQSAIATGLADRILPLAEIPEALLRYVRTDPHAEEDCSKQIADDRPRNRNCQIGMKDIRSLPGEGGK